MDTPQPTSLLGLRGWFRLMAAALVLVVLAGTARLVLVEWHQMVRAQAALEAVSRLRLALSVMEMVSRERGPANGVLGSEGEDAVAERQRLKEARARTDEAVARFQAGLGGLKDDDARAVRLTAQAQAFRQALLQARQVVDQQAQLPLATRHPQAIRRSVQGMVALVPRLAPAIWLFADQAQQAEPAIGSSVWAARLAAELREYAGQLGSLFTPALAHDVSFSTSELREIERVQGRIDELRSLLNVRLSLGMSSDDVARSHEAVERQYFGRGGALIDEVLDAGRARGGFDMGTAGFAQAYVPLMDPILALRDTLLAEAEHDSVAAREHSESTLVRAAVGAAAAMVLVLLMLRVALLRIVNPLAQTAEALQAMSAGQMCPVLPLPQADDEIAAVVRGVEALQQQSQARLALERERDALIASLRTQSTTDFLTGLPNRRAFFEAADAEMARARRHGFGLVLMLLDVDHFKRINDTLGHAAGDQALAAVSAMLRQSMRQGDLAARLGGEEFVALLSHCEPEDGWRFAERLREGIAQQVIEVNGGGASLSLTVSIGLSAPAPDGSSTLDTLMAQADGAMYQAKQAGRNRTQLAA